MTYTLTVLVPGIRTQNWLRLYQSVASAFNGSWEMVFISPYALPKELYQYKNIQHIESMSTPIRCQQEGLLKARGKYITWAADDGFFLPNSINISFIKLIERDLYYKVLVMGKYHEGENLESLVDMSGNEYYRLKHHDSLKGLKFAEEYLMLNVGIVSKKLLFEVGGWDCQFEVCPMAYNDLAVRLQNFGCEFIVQDELMFKCSHLPGHEGDHGPIHDAQTLFDEPLFNKIYSFDESNRRIEIPLDNWKQAPDRWVRRFGVRT